MQPFCSVNCFVVVAAGTAAQFALLHFLRYLDPCCWLLLIGVVAVAVPTGSSVAFNASAIAQGFYCSK